MREKTPAFEQTPTRVSRTTYAAAPAAADIYLKTIAVAPMGAETRLIA
ncbi:MAG TPA: hypothetical protein VGG98_06725 [Solirubrobacteraceae bacterium]|jgi:hypothetical protein